MRQLRWATKRWHWVVAYLTTAALAVGWLAYEVGRPEPREGGVGVVWDGRALQRTGALGLAANPAELRDLWEPIDHRQDPPTMNFDRDVAVATTFSYLGCGLGFKGAAGQPVDTTLEVHVEIGRAFDLKCGDSTEHTALLAVDRRALSGIDSIQLVVDGEPELQSDLAELTGRWLPAAD